MIRVSNLTKAYGESFNLNIPDLVIPNTEIFGIVGDNGVGKTTFLRAILDLIKIDSGTIFIERTNIKNKESWKSITGSYIDESFLIDHLTATEYFKVCGYFYGIAEVEIEKRMLTYQDFLNSIALDKKLIRELSTGNKKKVGIVSNFIVNPRLIVFDEPFSGLDPSSKIKLKKILKKLNTQRDVTIVISSHDLSSIEEICTSAVLFKNGSIDEVFNKKEGNITDIRKKFVN